MRISGRPGAPVVLTAELADRDAARVAAKISNLPTFR